MSYNEKDRFYERVESRVGYDPDRRAGLRDAILKNQTLKALVYIELLFEELEKGTATTPKTAAKPTEPTKKVDSKPKRTTPAKTKTTTESKPEEESGEKKDDETQS